jgi:L-cysteine:1D-myo-inositol 2-amino-2-deoxy-alpha-D-glucopyranoside ligase
MKLYNTLSQTIEPFTPQDETVTIYVCGITPYDTTHLGHAFTYTTADLLIRYLEYRGHTVRYVQNVTDIDDDILRKAGEVGEDWRALGDRWTAHFIRDMQSLNVRPPDHFPRATDVVEEIIGVAQALLQAGVAYEAGGNVYFQVDAWPAFGRLSHLPRSAMLPIANERGNRPDDPHKRDPLDFVLWQAAAPGEPTWPSPWGPGRPGWHIECSTLALKFLGETIDIHSGGDDLVFPHHECEIAQVEPVTGRRPFVRYWLHTAMVEHQGEKMSKSLGNLVMIRDLRETWSPDALRLYLGQHHYRAVWSHNEAELAEAADWAETLRRAVTAVSDHHTEPLDPAPAQRAFQQAMDNDLDAAGALLALRELAAAILAADGRHLAPAQAALRAMCAVFGLRLDATTAEAHVMAGWNEHLKQFEPVETS